MSTAQPCTATFGRDASAPIDGRWTGARTSIATSYTNCSPFGLSLPLSLPKRERNALHAWNVRWRGCERFAAGCLGIWMPSRSFARAAANSRSVEARVPVIDSSLVVALALQDARALAVQALLRTWIAGDVELHAPALLPFEVASGLTQAVAAGKLMADRVAPAWQSAMDIPLTYHLLGPAGEAAVAIARRLERQSAYDAAYLALALALRSEVWTFDRKLAHNAGNLGYPVRLVESAA